MLVNNQYAMKLENVIEKLLFETLTDQWEKAGSKSMYRDIKERIKAEIELK